MARSFPGRVGALWSRGAIARFRPALGLFLGLLIWGHRPAAQGAELALEAYGDAQDLVQKGELERAIELLAEVVAGEIEDARMGALLRVQLAEYERSARLWRRSLAHLDEALAQLGDSEYERRLRGHASGIRGQVYLDWGLLDLAQGAFEDEAASVAWLVSVGASAERERLNSWLHRANLGLAKEQVGEVEEVLRETRANPELFAAFPGQRARIELRMGYALAELARSSPEVSEQARSVLEGALADGALAADERSRGHLAVAELSLRAEDIERADQELGRVSGWTESPELEVRRASLGLRLCLARGAGLGELESWYRELTRAFAGCEEDWRETPPRPGGYGFLQYAWVQLAVGAQVEFLLASDGQEGVRRALELCARMQGLGDFERSLGVRAASMEEVRLALLTEGRAALVLLPTPDRCHLFYLDGSTCRYEQLAPMGEIEAVVASLNRTLRIPQASLPEPQRGLHRSEQSRLRRDLAELLVPAEWEVPLAALDAVLLVGFDLVGSVAFETLPVSESEFFGAEVAVSHLPSLALGVWLGAQDDEPREGTAWLLASPSVPEEQRERWGLDSLELQEGELKGMFEAYRQRGLPTREAYFAQASEELLGQGALAEAQVLQLFAHGVYDLGRERPAGILLSPTADADGVLWAEEIEALAAPPLVVLAACTAGLGPKRSGDVLATDLGGAFLRAGARAVVLSDFAVGAETTLLFSRELHRSLAGGDTVAQAARSARSALIVEGLEDPYDHGLLRVIGHGELRLFPPASGAPTGHGSLGWWWALALASALALTWVGLRRGARPQ